MAREGKRKRDERRFGKPERLADGIAEMEWAPPPAVILKPEFRESWLADCRSIREQVGRSVVFRADNVFEYCATALKGKTINWKESIPNYMPPFDRIFIEIHRPESGPLSSQADPVLLPAWGCLISKFNKRDVESEREKSPLPEGIPSGWEYILQTAIIVKFRGKPLLGLSGFVLCAISETGELIGEPLEMIPIGLHNPPEVNEELKSLNKSILFPVFMALAFMNCKNVAIAPVEPDRVIDRERKKARLKPFVRYHTIDIEPMKKVLRTEGNIEANGLRKALHIVRGHFTHYSEERPLFGRPGLHGTFWTPAHTRGSLDQGIVISDYNVKAPP